MKKKQFSSKCNFQFLFVFSLKKNLIMSQTLRNSCLIIYDHMYTKKKVTRFKNSPSA